MRGLRNGTPCFMITVHRYYDHKIEPRRTIRILRGSFLLMSLYCSPVRISAAGSDIGLLLTGLRMIEEGFCRFVIAIERRHGICDQLSAVVVLQYVLDVRQCRENEIFSADKPRRSEIRRICCAKSKHRDRLSQLYGMRTGTRDSPYL